jgi:predicted metal-dependent phosphoesterase TrpH
VENTWKRQVDLIKADLHVHSCYSPDCCIPLEVIVNRCCRVGINCLALSDHNTIEGALKLKEMAPFYVIVAEEIMTNTGELMGLFLTEEIPKGLSAEETISRIKKQGGLVNLPHPFGRWPLDSYKKLTSPEIMEQLDMIEVFNARTPLPNSSRKAYELARKYGLPGGAGSDAHTASEIGRSYVEMPEFSEAAGFLQSLSQGKINGHKSSPMVHLATTWAKVRKKQSLHHHNILDSGKADKAERKDIC